MPNTSDSGVIRLIFEEALINVEAENVDEDVESLVVDDPLLNYLLVMRGIRDFRLSSQKSAKKGSRSKRAANIPDGHCPFTTCRKLRVSEKSDHRKCNCEYYVAYAYRFIDEAAIKLADMTEQRGGPARLLQTDKNEVAKGLDNTLKRRMKSALDDFEKPEFGILLIGPDGIYFFEENPAEWTNQAHLNEFQLQNSESVGAGLIKPLSDGEKGKVGAVIDFQSLEGISLIHRRVPTLEVVVKGRKQDTVHFSLMSDYNV